VSQREHDEPAAQSVTERSPGPAIAGMPGGREFLAMTPDGVRALQRMAGNRAARGAVRSAMRQRRLARKVGDGHDLQSPRFAGDLVLEAAFDGEKPVKRGASGLPVIRIKQALADFGISLSKSGVDGNYDADTETAVKEFQRRMKITQSGEVDAATMAELDRIFVGRNIDRMLAQAPGIGAGAAPAAPLTEYARGSAPAALKAGTRTLTAAERTAVETALTPTPTVDPSTGLPPVFKPKLKSGEVYETRIKKRLEEVLNRQFTRVSGLRAQRAKPDSLHDMKDIERVAVQAKAAVDRVFGTFARRAAFKEGTNLFDRWTDQDTKIALMTPAQKHEIAVWRVEKVFRTDDDIKAINKEHGVRRERAPEKAIIAKVEKKIAKARESQLLEIHIAWPGSADPATARVFIQRFKETTPEGNRRFMWKMFQTLIHEYIHTLSHSRYHDWADRSPDERGHTLREGMTDYFTKTVWSTVNPNDPALRKEVEGPYYDAKASPNAPPLHTYDEATDAEKAVGVAGARNAYAAFFLGEIELLGGS
jgi:peptidoglycan hydrolase-like protein with peptidoglycan-binding domain